MIMAGAVLADDRPIDKPGTTVSVECELRVRGNPIPYVSRGGLKLAHALDEFHVDPEGLTVLDVGISTGGFTDCLLQRGVARVFGVDVGRGQVAWSLRQRPDVVLFEETNIRQFDLSELGGPVDLAVADVSFISLTLVLPVIWRALKPGGVALPMVKPQFEVGRAEVGKKGVVRDEGKRQEAVDRVREAACGLGFECFGQATSPAPGPKGNVEFFLHLVRPEAAT